MKVEVTEKIKISSDEKLCINKATEILNTIINNLTDETAIIDEQDFTDEIESLLTAALKLENKRIFSLFNMLDQHARDEITKEINAKAK